MTDVLIAGAGPTGLTLACELATRGVGVRVIDRSDRFFGGSRADGIQPRTMEVFADIGVLDRIVASGDLGIVMRAYQGDTVVWEGTMSEPVEPTPSVPYPNIWFVPQFRTEEILRERLAELGPVSKASPSSGNARGYGSRSGQGGLLKQDLGGCVELATELVDFTQDDGGVTATLVQGGATETVRVAYLVGADGGRSTVRKRLGIPFPGETDESTTMLFADAWVDGVGHDHGRIWQVGDSGVSVMPLAGTDQFVVVARPQEDLDEPIDEYLRRVVIESSGRNDIVVREVSWHTTWRANTRLAERFRSGRVFLAGDAGHVHPPTGGQGMNTGIQDGYNLGWKLAATLAGGSAALLDSYEPERMAAARQALDLSTALLEKHKRGDEDAHVRGPELHGFTLNYRGGLLSRDDRAEPGAVRAGDRAPDAPVTVDGRPARLFEVLHGPHWTLLSFGQAPDVSLPGVVVHAESGAAARDGYDMADGTLVLIRPDGYVGLVTDDVDHVVEYWSALHDTRVRV